MVRVSVAAHFATILLLLLAVTLPGGAFEPPRLVGDRIVRDSVSKGDRDSVQLSYTIPGLMVETTRKRYSELDNPAVELVRDAIAAEQRRRDSVTYSYRYRSTDRLTLALDHADRSTGWLRRLFPFFEEYLVRSPFDGRAVLPLSIRDRVSDFGYNAEDGKVRELIRYSAVTGLDQSIDDGTMTVALEEIFPRVDLFDRDIALLHTRFASPLCSDGPNRYKYYLADTVIMRGEVARTVAFVPFVPRDPTFSGLLFFTAEDPPRLLRSDLFVPDVSHLNFIDTLTLTQWYNPLLPDRRQVKEESLSLSFRLFRKLLPLYVHQARSYTDYAFVAAGDTIPEEDRVLYSSDKPIEDWSRREEASRYAPMEEQLLASDRGLKEFVSRVEAIPLYKGLITAVDMISHDYIRTHYNPRRVYGGSRFDVGPVTEMVGANEVEGLRLRLGGRTTAFITPRFFLDGYLAYGFKDQVLKHSLSVSWSFLSKRYYREEFPRDELRLTKSYDLFTPGQLYTSDPKDNSYYHYGTSYLTNRSYRNIWSLEYLHDYGSALTLRVYLQHVTDRPVENGIPYLKVMKDGHLERQWSITDAAAGIELRWTPGEKLRPGSIERHSPYRGMIKREHPIISLKHETAARVLGGQYLRNRTELRVEQRLPLSTFGRLDYQLTLGKLWNPVPFPLLYIPPTNRGFLLHDNGFKVLYPLEYVADEWVTLFAQWHMRGLVANRIPFLRKLDIRGVLSINYLYGNTTKHNRQENATDLFVLPTIATEMRHQSYLEVGFGIENILKLGRIDLYRRITPSGPYGQHSPWAVRGTLRFDF